MELTCEQACQELDCYLDGEQTVVERSLIAVHLACCCDCAEVLRFQTRVRVEVARCCAEAVPAPLRMRVLRAIYTADS